MSFLVRELDDPQAGAGYQLTTPRNTAPRARCTPYDRLQEMGSHDFDDHTGCPKCHPSCVAVHLQAEAHQPNCEGQARKRVPPVDSSTHARQQVLGRQHIHEQDMGRGLRDLGTRGAYHGGGVSEQYALQPFHVKDKVGGVAWYSGQIRNLLRPSFTSTRVRHYQPRRPSNSFASCAAQLHSLATNYSANVTPEPDDVLAKPFSVLEYTTSATPGHNRRSFASWCSP
jgi:hypothetical protein